MGKEATILSLIASITTGQILFSAVYLWMRSKKHLPNKILSVLLFCYALRIIKSVLLLSFPNLTISSALIAIGVIGMSAIGPLLFFYVHSLLKSTFAFSYKHFLHFIPAVLLLPTAFFLDNNSMFFVYQFSVYQIFIYLAVSVAFLLREKAKERYPTVYSWLTNLLVAVSLLSVIFLIQLYTGNRSVYIIISLVAAIIFYIISILAAFEKNAFYPVLKKKSRNVKNIFLPSIQKKVKEERLFLNPQLTVSKLALSLNIPSHTLSAAINEGTGMTFNEYLNTFRIKEAADRLASGDFVQFSIEGIAYDCGFNSLSAFYSAFKKVYNTTPAKFRQQIFPDSGNQEDILQNPVRV